MGKRGPAQLPRLERFLARVEKTDGCWLWRGTINRHRGGYGYFYDDDQRLRRAHVLAYEMFVGSIEGGLYVLHSCDVAACVNPAHLSLGDQATNQRQMALRGRAHKTGESGEARYNAKLTDDLVRRARALRDAGGSVAPLAREAGVGYDNLLHAAQRKSWKHVTD